MQARTLLLLCGLTLLQPGIAAPVTYELDPAHTYPSFEADHLGISLWRGKFNRSEGTVTLDRAAGVGEVRVEVDIASVDFGHDEMNKEARGSGILDADAHPRASYRGTLAGFVDGEPARVDGELTLHGVTRPLVLRIAHFHCIPHPLHQRELCGVDAQASIDRAEFGIDAGRDYGFDMTVALRIQAEAVAVP